MTPIDGFKAWKTEVKRKREKDPRHLFAILIYSKANKNLIDFVHKHYFTLTDLTGPDAFADFSDRVTTYNLVRHFGLRHNRYPA
ncbi:MAG: hypothetical protein ACFFER_13150 [Candidatus Thorarchaeota archaeon]